MSNILIAGCGDVGTALGLELAADGHAVFALRRKVSGLPGVFTPVAADLTAPATLRGLPRVDYLYYTAAADGRDDAAYERAYVTGLRNILQALSVQKPRHVFYVSSTSVYGQRSGEWVDEDSETGPSGFNGARVLEGEGVLAGGPCAATAVRFGGIYGPGRTRLIDQVRAGASCVGEPPVFTNRIHRDDCAGMLRHLLTLNPPADRYIGVDCDPAAQCAVMEWLAWRLGAPAPRRERLDAGSSRGKRCSNARLLASGYAFRYPTFREGYSSLIGETAAQARSSGKTDTDRIGT
ncbi:MAG TPA: NAD-dependent epimerase/dehydratase family protein [Gammaproteobacteria bacterium]